MQYDYAQSIGLTDLQYGSNVRQLEQTETWDWMYETRLEYCARPDEETWFVAEETDYRFCILLDGEPIAAQEGMFTPVKINLTGRVYPGALLRIHIYPHPNRGGQWSSYHQVVDQSCKPPVTYGWDWNPRLVISGLWRPAYIETRGAGRATFSVPCCRLRPTRCAGAAGESPGRCGRANGAADARRQRDGYASRAAATINPFRRLLGSVFPQKAAFFCRRRRAARTSCILGRIMLQ